MQKLEYAHSSYLQGTAAHDPYCCQFSVVYYAGCPHVTETVLEVDLRASTVGLVAPAFVLATVA